MFLRRSLAVLALALTTGSVSAAPAIWKVSDEDSAVWLFGSIHMLPDGYDWRTPRFNAALARAGTLVLEIADVGDANAQASAYKAVATAPGLPPILDRAPADKRAALAAAIDKAGLKPAQLDGLKTWAAALTIGTMTGKGSVRPATA